MERWRRSLRVSRTQQPAPGRECLHRQPPGRSRPRMSDDVRGRTVYQPWLYKPRTRPGPAGSGRKAGTRATQAGSTVRRGKWQGKRGRGEMDLGGFLASPVRLTPTQRTRILAGAHSTNNVSRRTALSRYMPKGRKSEKASLYEVAWVRDDIHDLIGEATRRTAHQLNPTPTVDQSGVGPSTTVNASNVSRRTALSRWPGPPTVAATPRAAAAGPPPPAPPAELPSAPIPDSV